MTHRLLPEPGVLVVEVTEPLRAQDFDALAATVDTWLATDDALPGVVFHARAFPGWENIDGLLRHIRFVRDRHRRVRRVALAVDSTAGRPRAPGGRALRRRPSCATSATTTSTAPSRWAAGPNSGRTAASTAEPQIVSRPWARQPPPGRIRPSFLTSRWISSPGRSRS